MAATDTRFSTPSYDPNIPIVTPAGGNPDAYKDPKSPESIIKKTTEINAQSAVDSKYDVTVSAHEGFRRRGGGLGRGLGRLTWPQYFLISFAAFCAVLLLNKNKADRNMNLRFVFFIVAVYGIVKLVSQMVNSQV